MIFRALRLIVVVVVTLATLASCSFAKTAEHSPASPKAPIDYLALEAAIENKIVTGSVALDNVCAVLVSVDGETKISHYRHGFTAEDTTHVWSITKSVVSTLIGIAISDGIIDSLDQTLGELLPRQRLSMSVGMTDPAGGVRADPCERDVPRQ